MTAFPQETLDFLRGARVYFDANIFILHYNERMKHLACLNALWEMLEDGNLQVVTSELSLEECLVGAIKVKDHETERHFATTLSNGGRLIVVPISREILVEAARQRALHGLDTPDAIHSATAKIARCRWFLTNDAALATATGAKALSLAALSEAFEI